MVIDYFDLMIKVIFFNDYRNTKEYKETTSRVMKSLEYKDMNHFWWFQFQNNRYSKEYDLIVTLLDYQFISKEKTKADIAGRLINNILSWGEILSRTFPMSFTFYGICTASMKFGWMYTVCN